MSRAGGGVLTQFIFCTLSQLRRPPTDRGRLDDYCRLVQTACRPHSALGSLNGSTARTVEEIYSLICERRRMRSSCGKLTLPPFCSSFVFKLQLWICCPTS